MNKIVSTTLAALLSGCASYKVEVIEEAPSIRRAIAASDPITVKQENSYPEGFQCFEPMMFALTLGLIPTHCVNTYSVSSAAPTTDQQEAIVLGTFKITTMGGWAALIIAPLPKWRFGSPSEPELEIKQALSHEQ
ncbi:hypothetical protein [Pseudomonas zhanjiangensis]|uniref:Lipoprotein n=1 Tax=Pseudomonas zhanjiangensis TaxID=3239015 RepID=A0ABV3YXZ5_9PSED